MRVIAGLGNPGEKYAKTRHNLGFMTIDLLAEKYDIRISRARFRSLTGEGTIEGERVLLLKPMTYMNLSGEAIRPACDYYKIDPQDLLVIYDDVDIPLGSIRLRKSGSAGTHNGMRSVVTHLGNGDFPRIRIGIGSGDPSGNRDLIEHVIGSVGKEEQVILKESVEKAAEAAACWLREGIDIAMNRFNVRK